MRPFAILLLSVLFFGCKKDPVLTMEGKWKENAGTYKVYENYTLIRTLNSGAAPVTMHFRADGQMEHSSPVGTSITPYKIDGNKVTYWSRSYEIQDLEENSVTLFSISYDYGGGMYAELYTYLIRQ